MRQGETLRQDRIGTCRSPALALARRLLSIEGGAAETAPSDVEPESMIERRLAFLGPTCDGQPGLLVARTARRSSRAWARPRRWRCGRHRRPCAPPRGDTIYQRIWDADQSAQRHSRDCHGRDRRSGARLRPGRRARRARPGAPPVRRGEHPGAQAAHLRSVQGAVRQLPARSDQARGQPARGGARDPGAARGGRRQRADGRGARRTWSANMAPATRATRGRS